MKSISYKRYCELRTSETTGVLRTLSAYKRENPEESKYYSSAYDAACERILKANNRGVAQKENGKLFSVNSIIANTTGISNPNKPYKAANN